MLQSVAQLEIGFDQCGSMLQFVTVHVAMHDAVHIAVYIAVCCQNHKRVEDWTIIGLQCAQNSFFLSFFLFNAFLLKVVVE